jgi:hypothetical protein
VQNLITPQNIQSLVVFLLAFLARDVVVALVRALSSKLLTDKDKGNDDFGRLLAALADNIAKSSPRPSTPTEPKV